MLLEGILAELKTLNANLARLNAAAPSVGASGAGAGGNEKPAKSKQEKAPQVQVAEAVQPIAPPALSYDKDVKPQLLNVMAKAGQEALVGLLAKFGVDNGQKLPPEQYANIVAGAKVIIANAQSPI